MPAISLKSSKYILLDNTSQKPGDRNICHFTNRSLWEHGSIKKAPPTASPPMNFFPNQNAGFDRRAVISFGILRLIQGVESF